MGEGVGRGGCVSNGVDKGMDTGVAEGVGKGVAGGVGVGEGLRASREGASAGDPVPGQRGVVVIME